jgi:hypothetical protein
MDTCKSTCCWQLFVGTCLIRTENPHLLEDCVPCRSQHGDEKGGQRDLLDLPSGLEVTLLGRVSVATAIWSTSSTRVLIMSVLFASVCLLHAILLAIWTRMPGLAGRPLPKILVFPRLQFILVFTFATGALSQVLLPQILHLNVDVLCLSRGQRPFAGGSAPVTQRHGEEDEVYVYDAVHKVQVSAPGGSCRSVHGQLQLQC